MRTSIIILMFAFLFGCQWNVGPQEKSKDEIGQTLPIVMDCEFSYDHLQPSQVLHINIAGTREHGPEFIVETKLDTVIDGRHIVLVYRTSSVNGETFDIAVE